jgi:hypothetical protein
MLLRVGNNRRTCAMAAHGLPGLDWLNFFFADFQTSFGPFVSVYLTRTGWTQSTIGAVLTIPALVALNSLGEADRAPSEFARRRDWAADRGGL